MDRSGLPTLLNPNPFPKPIPKRVDALRLSALYPTLTLALALALTLTQP